MSTTLIVIIVAAVVVLAIGIAAGLLLARRRRISLRESERLPEKPESRSGGYTASTGFNLASGGTGTAERARPPETPEHPVADRTETEGQPAVGDDAAVPRDTQRRGIVDVGLPTEPAEAETRRADTAPSTEAQPAPEPIESSEPAEPEVRSGATSAPPTEAEQTPGPKPVEAEPAPVPAEPVEAQPEPTTKPAAEPEPAAEPQAEQIAPSEGRLERLRGRLSRSQSTFGQGLLGLLGAGDLDEDSWTDIEDTLVMADLGSATTMDIVEQLRTSLSSRAVRTATEARTALRDVLVTALAPEADRAVRALPHAGGPGVVLVAGVNGTGKTTTTGKLARVLVAQGRKVLLGAADTFRAAAVDQLQTWGERVGAETVRGAEGADPASVAFDAVQRGGESGVDTVLVDTAGRLHTKTGLMDELGKVKRVVEKQAKVDEVLLVLDATTGQNGLTQARVFAEVVDISGIVLTKLDGTAKGGIVFQVQRELGVPVKLVGLGEGADDLAPFEPAAFVDALLAE